MNLNIAKYTLLAATVSLAACQRDDDGYTEQLPAAEGNMSFSASFESSLSKAALHYDSEVPTSSSKIVTYFQSSDALSVFDGYANNKFTTQDNGANATFAGRAKASSSQTSGLTEQTGCVPQNAEFRHSLHPMQGLISS